MQKPVPISDTASQLIAAHGKNAPQQVVDRIVAAIRDHDIQSAKAWETVGQLVDEQLAA